MLLSRIIMCMHDNSDIRNPNETFDPLFAYFSNWYRRRSHIHFYKQLTQQHTGFIYYLCCCGLFIFLISLNVVLILNMYHQLTNICSSDQVQWIRRRHTISRYSSLFLSFLEKNDISHSVTFIARMMNSNSKLKAQFISLLKKKIKKKQQHSALISSSLNRNRFWSPLCVFEYIHIMLVLICISGKWKKIIYIYI